MIDLRISLAALCGVGVGALAALAAVHAAVSAAEATALAAAAVGVAGTGVAGALWLDAIRPQGEARSALVVFALFVALGLMLGGGVHAHA